MIIMIAKEVHTLKELKENINTIRKCCYIAGPITGVAGFREHFLEAERWLKDHGIIALNPVYHPVGLPYDDYFVMCFPMIDVSYAILLLPNWEHSKGVHRELEHARNSEKPYIVIYYDDMLTDSLPEIGHFVFGNYYGGEPIDRKTFQPLFERLLNKIDDTKPFENSTFVFNPYYWGDDEVKQAEPNFIYKPNFFCMRWYKYPLRDAYGSYDISVEEFEKMIDHCVNSLKE